MTADEIADCFKNEPADGIASVLAPLLASQASLAELEQAAQERFGVAGPVLAQAQLGRLADQRKLMVSPKADQDLTYIPYAQNHLFELLIGDMAEKPLTRFLLLRRVGKRIFVESPLAPAHLEIEDVTLATAVTQAMASGGWRPPANSEGDIRADFLRTVLSLHGFCAETADTDEHPYWEFHDLYFHTRSRLGRHGNPAGATYRMADRFAGEPAIRVDISGTKFFLPIPSSDQIDRFDPPLSVVMNARRSVRTTSALPLTREDLGHFLYRCAFVHGLMKTEYGEFTRRVYPSGGGSYELEIYLLVTRVQGFHPGVYLYDATDNSLMPVAGEPTAYSSLLSDAYTAAANTVVPDVLFVFASRIKRLSFKYSAISYATTLKNVGALYANMYLVGTAMDLAPCALGLGNSDTFARLTGTDYLSECSVGEFMLSRRH